MVCSVFSILGIRCLRTCYYGLVYATVRSDCESICAEREENKQKTKKSSYSYEIDTIGTYSTFPTMVAKVI